MLSKLSIILMLAYPIVAHTTLWLERPLFIIGYLIFIFSLLAIDKCLNKHWYSGLTLFIISGFIAYFMQQTYAQYLLYFPPILILFSLFLLFSHSLQSGQIPLITRYAVMMNDNKRLEERHFRYTQSLTRVWSVFLLLMVLTSIFLAIFYSKYSWSLFSNIISYILITAFFIIEFFYRKRYLSGVASLQGGFFQYMRKVIKIRPHNITKNN